MLKVVFILTSENISTLEHWAHPAQCQQVSSTTGGCTLASTTSPPEFRRGIGPWWRQEDPKMCWDACSATCTRRCTTVACVAAHLSAAGNLPCMKPTGSQCYWCGSRWAGRRNDGYDSPSHVRSPGRWGHYTPPIHHSRFSCQPGHSSVWLAVALPHLFLARVP